MRVSTLDSQQRAISALLDQQAQLNRTQLQISTGRRILTAADDPTGAERVLSLKEQLAGNQQFARNAGVAKNRLQLEETTLDNITQLVQGIRERIVQGANATLTPQDRRFVAAELEQSRDAILQLANTRDANGEFLFSGNKTRTEAFGLAADGSVVYNGDQARRELAIGPGLRVAVGDSGTEVFERIPNGNGVFRTSDGTANTGSGVITQGTLVDPARYDQRDYTIVMADITGAAAGGGQGVFTDVVGADDALGYELRINGTLVHGQAEADAPLADLDALAAAINDDTGTTGVGAHVAGGALYLVHEPPGAGDIVVEESLTGASDAGDEISGYFGSVLQGPGARARVTLDGPAGDYVVLDDLTGQPVASGGFTPNGQIEFRGIRMSIQNAPNTGDRFSVRPSNSQDLFATVQNAIDALRGTTTTTNQQTAFNNAIGRSLADLDQGLENLLDVRAQVGSRLAAIDTEETILEDVNLFTETTLSQFEDLDFARAASELNLQLTAVQAAQQAFVRVQGLTLFEFL